MLPCGLHIELPNTNRPIHINPGLGKSYPLMLYNPVLLTDDEVRVPRWQYFQYQISLFQEIRSLESGLYISRQGTDLEGALSRPGRRIRDGHSLYRYSPGNISKEKARLR